MDRPGSTPDPTVTGRICFLRGSAYNWQEDGSVQVSGKGAVARMRPTIERVGLALLLAFLPCGVHSVLAAEEPHPNELAPAASDTPLGAWPASDWLKVSVASINVYLKASPIGQSGLSVGTSERASGNIVSRPGRSTSTASRSRQQPAAWLTGRAALRMVARQRTRARSRRRRRTLPSALRPTADSSASRPPGPPRGRASRSTVVPLSPFPCFTTAAASAFPSSAHTPSQNHPGSPARGPGESRR